MLRASRWLGLASLGVGLCSLFAQQAPAPTPLAVDFRYAPERWLTALCPPDDSRKTLINRQGELLYDFPGRHLPALAFPGRFEPGEFEGFKLQVAVGLLEGEAFAPLTWQAQTLAGPRVPVVRTVRRAGAIEITEEAFAVVPVETPAGAEAVPPPALLVERIDPEHRVRYFAEPTIACDPGFRHTALAIRKAVRYRFPAHRGTEYTVVFGLCEGQHTQSSRRLLDVRIEGQTRQTVDLAAHYGRNVPAALPFTAKDENGDGMIDLMVVANAKSPDREAILGLLWIFDTPPPSAEAVRSGGSRGWLARVECGTDGQARQQSRQEIVIVRLRNTGPAMATVRPGVQLKSDYRVEPGRDGRSIDLEGEHALVATAPFQVRASGKGAHRLQFEPVTLGPGAGHAFALGVMSGGRARRLPGSLREAETLRERAVAWWQEASLPYDRITVPDTGIQALLDSSIRNIYQAREIKGGLPSFQVGATIYRGLWVVDGAFLLEAIAMLGRTEEARRGVQRMLSFQRGDGGIELLEQHWKETGIVMWAAIRHARLTNDREWLRTVWPQIERGFAYLQRLRAGMGANPAALNYRLMPHGFSDGGLAGSFAEYTNIYWTLIGMKAAIEAADWLGQGSATEAWRREYEDYFATFQRAAARDARSDAQGNRYIPTRMDPAQKLTPQRGQWAFLHAIHPGRVFAPNDPLMRGTLAALQAAERQGLIYGNSVPIAIWGYLGSFYAHAWLWLGDGEKAARTLYAFANHASPLLAWREEQMPVGEHDPRDFGDMPHNWASAEFIRLVRDLLVLERGEELHLLEGLPAGWIRPGARVHLRALPTEFGPLTLELQVADDGRSARLRLDPRWQFQPVRVQVHLGRWAESLDRGTVATWPHTGAGELVLRLSTGLRP